MGIYDSTIAVVNNGVVTPVGNGNTSILVSCGTKEITIPVSVSGVSEPLEIEWELGVIGGNGGNGQLVDNPARIRTTGYIPANAQSITAKSGYEFCVCCYNSSGNIGRNVYYSKERGTLAPAGEAAKYYTSLDISTMNVGEYTNLKIIARRKGLKNMSVSEGTNIVVR